MQDTIIAIFCYVDDFLKALSWKDDGQCRLCLAEIVTIALTAVKSKILCKFDPLAFCSCF
jgi:hypothetical protein